MGGTLFFSPYLTAANPPYQDEQQGNSKTALPIYNKFMDNSYDIGNVVELITPARFLFNAGRTPREWNDKMLNDVHLKVLYYEPDGTKIFPNTDIKGGVAITYHDMQAMFEPIRIFTIYPELNSILNKVNARIQEHGVFSDICFVASKFNVTNLFSDYPEYIGHERRMSSNVLQFHCFNDEFDNKNNILIYGVHKNKRCRKYIRDIYVDLNDENIYKYKIIIPKADGSGAFGDTLTQPEILPMMSGFTHTFMGIGGFNTMGEAEAALKYLKTKFARTLLSVLKVTQDMNAEKWKYVPLQNFNPPPQRIRQRSSSYCIKQRFFPFSARHRLDAICA